MASATDIQGTVFQQATATFMARVEDSEANSLDQAAVDSLSYTVSKISPDDRGLHSYILGHEHVALDNTGVIFDTLQTDATWSVDATGYNFRHEIDISLFDAFPQAGETYQVRYEVTPTVGQKIVFRFCVRCI